LDACIREMAAAPRAMAHLSCKSRETGPADRSPAGSPGPRTLSPIARRGEVLPTRRVPP